MISNNDIFKQIDSHKIISFDVYDTLLLRPFSNPSDLFEYIEYKYDIKGFASARNGVNVSGVKEKSIEDIYDNMPPDYKDCIRFELAEEKNVVYENDSMREIYNYAVAQHKTVILASDIYFHEDYLNEVLRKRGFDKYTKLYCSCDYQKTKNSGELFQQILSDYQVNPNDILHIGDNEVSDYAVPKAIGIDARHIQQKIRSYYEYKPYLAESRFDFWDSFIVKMCADLNSVSPCGESETEQCWYRFGYEAAGPICWTFAKWLRDKVDSEEMHISNLAFVARDGYLLKMMFDRLDGNKPVKTHYIYAPRILTTLLQETYKDRNYKQDLLEKERGLIDEVYDIGSLSNSKRAEFISELSKKYAEYLAEEQFGDGNIGVVDSTTNNLSSQKLVSLFSENSTYGLYWYASEYAFSIGENVFACQPEHYMVVESPDLFELIFKSPESPIRKFNLNGKIDFCEPNTFEIERIKNFQWIEKGAMCFFENAESKNLYGYPPAAVINRYLIRYYQNPIEKERKIIEDGYSSGGIGNSDWGHIKVFVEKNHGVTKASIRKALKQSLIKHPRLFIFLRRVYHTINKNR